MSSDSDDDLHYCSSCGRHHPGLPTDWGYKMPDEVHALDYITRYTRCHLNPDLCTLDDSRHFIRGVLPVPLLDAPGASFHWGVWVEVDRATHDTYAQGFKLDLSTLPRAHATLANHIPGYGGTLGLPVELQYAGADQRPSIWFPPDFIHALALEQRAGISAKRHHVVLQEVGLGDKDDADD